MTLLELIDEKIKGVEGLRDCDIEREFKTLRALKCAVEALEGYQHVHKIKMVDGKEIDVWPALEALTQIKSIIEGEA